MIKILITGGAGFIGSNAAFFFLSRHFDVTILDNFKRLGTAENILWLRKNFKNISVIEGDIRSQTVVKRAVKNQDIILHLAGQVAVTASVTDPRTDFEVNALGSFNILEAARLQLIKPFIIFSSTNKVYGGMDNVTVSQKNNCYVYKDYPFGINEQMNLDFHSPYGCSKGAADQYMRDYYRIYGIPTVVFRQSCIYGPRQFGIEDQGWIAWFIIAQTIGKPITIYGDGKQVRDILYIDDLLKLFNLTINNKQVAQGKIYNIGGGPNNTLSVWSQFGPLLEKHFGRKLKASFSDWRPGDQKIYVSDIRLAEKELGWKPEIPIKQGIQRLFTWIQNNRAMFRKLFE